MLEVRPEILIRLRNQARALRDVGQARNNSTQKLFCSCCCEYFKDGDDRRSIVAHMHEDCIDQLLSPDGKPVVGSKPRSHPPRIVDAVVEMDFAPPKAPQVVSSKATEDLADKIAERVDWLTEARQEQLVKDVADEVIARLKPTLDRWEKAVERLEEMLNDA